jgi:Ni/Fe-hydrogenase subunit HybB-like protein
MTTSSPPSSRPVAATDANYFRFIWHLIGRSVEGSPRFYVWMALLSAVALVGANAWAKQVVAGMGVTGMSDHVSWGLYIANFTFGVGLAAGAVMMVIPAYLYDDHEMHDAVIIGELLAIAAIVVCLLFITADLGRPDRFWHIIPGLGRFNWPISMLTWDVLVLNGYLALNLHVAGYLTYMRYIGRTPRKIWYVPFVLVSIAWAVSIHSVTAFLYAGLGGRPFWNTALLAPRFIASAFISGPALVIVVLQLLQHLTRLPLGEGPKRLLTSVLRVTVLVNLFMVASEAFTAFYTGGQHAVAARYLFLGLHGHSKLVPWIWTAVVLNLSSVLLLFIYGKLGQARYLNAACLAAFVGVWIEKGMGLIIPGFVPSTLHELVEYAPTASEWKITFGIWAFGAMLLTVALKVILPIVWRRERTSLSTPPPAVGD